MKVLVADDEHLVRWFLERALRKWGHNVTSVESSDDAMARMTKVGFDVLFTDLRMPRENGANLLQRLEELPNRPGKVVVCSAFINPDLSRSLEKKGILTLKKPFRLADLENTITQCKAK